VVKEPSLTVTNDMTPAPTLDGNASLVLHHADRFAGTFPLDQDEITVGSAPDNSLVLASPSVDPVHAVIRKKNDRWVIQDAGSAKGIRYRGERRARLALRPGDQIDIGVFRLTYVRGDDEPASGDLAPPTPAPSASAPRAEATIDFAGVTYPLMDEHFNIGSDPHSHLRLSGLFVASQHAQISRRPDGTFRISHITGRAPVKVNGKETKFAPLSHGDVIAIGKHQLLFSLSPA
jgi:pSer/pThr/pTyr-binding forkhead associated (FHA) protein